MDIWTDKSQNHRRSSRGRGKKKKCRFKQPIYFCYLKRTTASEAECICLSKKHQQCKRCPSGLPSIITCKIFLRSGLCRVKYSRSWEQRAEGGHMGSQNAVECHDFPLKATSSGPHCPANWCVLTETFEGHIWHPTMLSVQYFPLRATANISILSGADSLCCKELRAASIV